jgi:hypothetical protein
MTEPTFTAATEDTYRSLAQYLRAADRRQGTWPLKRFLAPILDQLGVVLDLYRRMDYTAKDEFGADTRALTFYYNLVVNPSFEELAPLPDTTVNATADRTADHVSHTQDSGGWAWLFLATAPGDFGGKIAANRVAVSTPVITVSADAYAFPGRTVRLQVEAFDAADSSLGTVHGDLLYNGPGYVRLSTGLALPAGTVAADVYAFALNGAGGGEQFYVDCVQVVADNTDVPYRRYAGVLTGETSELVTPETADDEWLPWLAQLVGVDLNPALTREAKVDAIRFASAGWQGGTKAAVAAAAKSVLTGTRYVQVFDHSTEAGVGTGGEWDVLLVTRQTETPDVGAVLDAVVAQKAKPAGVVLHHLAYNATWADVEAAYPTWADWVAAGSWARLEEAGLP